ncbi:MAG: transcriptional regulator NrdR [Candidatus Uhrbacteria bacterium]|nr:transcriptional regulator NrdR [Candidatus Uhrbacteria bacterium]
MHCPICDHEDTRVVDSRMGAEGSAIRRRRECDKCGFRFSTAEEIILLDLVVIKRDGQREAYDREKLVRGLKRALQKRPFTEASFRSLVHNIERDIQRLRTDEVTSEQLGSLVMQRLKTFDQVAYIRFASVYRQFEDAETFQRELEDLLKLSEEERKERMKKPRL